MKLLAVSLCILYSRNQLWVLRDRTIGNCTVDLEKVLIYHATATDVEVTYLAVTHLTCRKTYILTTCLKLGVRENRYQMIPIWSRSIEDDITLTVVTNTPTVKNYQ